MGKTPLSRSLIVGSALQIGMVLVGKLVPALGQEANFFPIAGSTIAAIMGVNFSKVSAGASMGSSLGGGAVVGGGCSLVGAALAAATGQMEGAAAQVIAIATGTGAVAGIVGALIGRFLPAPSKS